MNLHHLSVRSTAPALVVLYLLAIQGNGQAQGAISIDLGAGNMSGQLVAAMQPVEFAGFIPANNWNSYPEVLGSLQTYEGTFSNLMDNAGSATGASATFSGPNNWQIFVASTDEPGNIRMMSSYLDAYGTDAPSTVTVSNLPSSYTANGYDVYVYFEGFAAQPPRISRYEITSDSMQKVYYGRQGASGVTDYTMESPFVQATGTSDQGAQTPEGNYVLFTGLMNSDFTLVSYGTSGDINRASVQGIQIVARTAPPVNQQPTAGEDDLGVVLAGAAVTVDLSVLVANDSDPDGDRLTVTAVSASSAKGGSVVLGTNNVTYTSAVNYSGLDSFTYTISDGHGGQATGTVKATVAPPYTPSSSTPVISIDIGAGLSGDPSLQSQMSSDEVAGVVPVSNWNSFEPSSAPQGQFKAIQDNTGAMVTGVSVSFHGDAILSTLYMAS